MPLRILITNNTLRWLAGTELYVRDVALGLLARGHTPIAYSSELGEVAAVIREATVPVIDDLDRLAVPPNVIHGQHHLETMTAVARFPASPPSTSVTAGAHGPRSPLASRAFSATLPSPGPAATISSARMESPRTG